jgi:hypothetical protein
MRSLVYEIFGLGLLASSMLFFYRCIEFLASKDYVAGLAVLAIGFLVLRAGSELGKMAVLLRREEGP